METPEWEPTNLILTLETPAILMWSYALEKKQPKVEAKGILFLADKPIVTETKFYSAMKHSTNLSGKAFLKVRA